MDTGHYTSGFIPSSHCIHINSGHWSLHIRFYPFLALYSHQQWTLVITHQVLSLPLYSPQQWTLVITHQVLSLPSTVFTSTVDTGQYTSGFIPSSHCIHLNSGHWSLHIRFYLFLPLYSHQQWTLVITHEVLSLPSTVFTSTVDTGHYTSGFIPSFHCIHINSGHWSLHIRFYPFHCIHINSGHWSLHIRFYPFHCIHLNSGHWSLHIRFYPFLPLYSHQQWTLVITHQVLSLPSTVFTSTVDTGHYTSGFIPSFHCIHINSGHWSLHIRFYPFLALCSHQQWTLVITHQVLSLPSTVFTSTVDTGHYTSGFIPSFHCIHINSGHWSLHIRFYPFHCIHLNSGHWSLHIRFYPFLALYSPQQWTLVITHQVLSLPRTVFTSTVDTGHYTSGFIPSTVFTSTVDTGHYTSGFIPSFHCIHLNSGHWSLHIRFYPFHCIHLNSGHWSLHIRFYPFHCIHLNSGHWSLHIRFYPFHCVHINSGHWSLHIRFYPFLPLYSHQQWTLVITHQVLSLPRTVFTSTVDTGHYTSGFIPSFHCIHLNSGHWSLHIRFYPFHCIHLNSGHWSLHIRFYPFLALYSHQQWTLVITHQVLSLPRTVFTSTVDTGHYTSGFIPSFHCIHINSGHWSLHIRFYPFLALYSHQQWTLVITHQVLSLPRTVFTSTVDTGHYTSGFIPSTVFTSTVDTGHYTSGFIPSFHCIHINSGHWSLHIRFYPFLALYSHQQWTLVITHQVLSLPSTVFTSTVDTGHYTSGFIPSFHCIHINSGHWSLHMRFYLFLPLYSPQQWTLVITHEVLSLPSTVFTSTVDTGHYTSGFIPSSHCIHINSGHWSLHIRFYPFLPLYSHQQWTLVITHQVLSLPSTVFTSTVDTGHYTSGFIPSFHCIHINSGHWSLHMRFYPFLPLYSHQQWTLVITHQVLSLPRTVFTSTVDTGHYTSGFIPSSHCIHINSGHWSLHIRFYPFLALYSHQQWTLVITHQVLSLPRTVFTSTVDTGHYTSGFIPSSHCIHINSGHWSLHIRFYPFLALYSHQQWTLVITHQVLSLPRTVFTSTVDTGHYTSGFIPSSHCIHLNSGHWSLHIRFYPFLPLYSHQQWALVITHQVLSLPSTVFTSTVGTGHYTSGFIPSSHCIHLNSGHWSLHIRFYPFLALYSPQQWTLVITHQVLSLPRTVFTSTVDTGHYTSGFIPSSHCIHINSGHWSLHIRFYPFLALYSPQQWTLVITHQVLSLPSTVFTSTVDTGHYTSGFIPSFHCIHINSGHWSLHIRFYPFLALYSPQQWTLVITHQVLSLPSTVFTSTVDTGHYTSGFIPSSHCIHINSGHWSLHIRFYLFLPLYSHQQWTLVITHQVLSLPRTVFTSTVDTGHYTSGFIPSFHCIHLNSGHWSLHIRFYPFLPLYSHQQWTLVITHQVLSLPSTVFTSTVDTGHYTSGFIPSFHCIHLNSGHWSLHIRFYPFLPLYSHQQWTLVITHQVLSLPRTVFTSTVDTGHYTSGFIPSTVFTSTVDTGHYTSGFISSFHCIHINSGHWSLHIRVYPFLALCSHQQWTLVITHQVLSLPRTVFTSTVDTGHYTSGFIPSFHCIHLNSGHWSLHIRFYPFHCIHLNSGHWSLHIRFYLFLPLYSHQQWTLVITHQVLSLPSTVFTSTVDTGHYTSGFIPSSHCIHLNSGHWSLHIRFYPFHCIHLNSGHWSLHIRFYPFLPLYSHQQWTLVITHQVLSLPSTVFTSTVDTGHYTSGFIPSFHCIHINSGHWSLHIRFYPFLALYSHQQWTLVITHQVLSLPSTVFTSTVDTGHYTSGFIPSSHCIHLNSGHWSLHIRFYPFLPLYSHQQWTLVITHQVLSLPRTVFTSTVDTGHYTSGFIPSSHCIHINSGHWSLHIRFYLFLPLYSPQQWTLVITHQVLSLPSTVFTSTVDTGHYTSGFIPSFHCIHINSGHWSLHIRFYPFLALYSPQQWTLVITHQVLSLPSTVFTSTVDTGHYTSGFIPSTVFTSTVDTGHYTSGFIPSFHCIHINSGHWSLHIRFYLFLALYSLQQWTLVITHQVLSLPRTVFTSTVDTGHYTSGFIPSSHCIHINSGHWSLHIRFYLFLPLYSPQQWTLVITHQVLSLPSTVFTSTVDTGHYTSGFIPSSHCIHINSGHWSLHIRFYPFLPLYSHQQWTLVITHQVLSLPSTVFTSTVDTGHYTSGFIPSSHCIHINSGHWSLHIRFYPFLALYSHQQWTLVITHQVLSLPSTVFTSTVDTGHYTSGFIPSFHCIHLNSGHWSLHIRFYPFLPLYSHQQWTLVITHQVLSLPRTVFTSTVDTGHYTSGFIPSFHCIHLNSGHWSLHIRFYPFLALYSHQQWTLVITHQVLSLPSTVFTSTVDTGHYTSGFIPSTVFTSTVDTGHYTSGFIPSFHCIHINSGHWSLHIRFYPFLALYSHQQWTLVITHQVLSLPSTVFTSTVDTGHYTSGFIPSSHCIHINSGHWSLHIRFYPFLPLYSHQQWTLVITHQVLSLPSTVFTSTVDTGHYTSGFIPSSHCIHLNSGHWSLHIRFYTH